MDDYAGDLTKVTIKHPSLQNPIVVPPQKDLDPRQILDAIEKTLTSHEDLDAKDDMTVTVGAINLPSGEGRTHVTNLARDMHYKKSISVIRNSDSLCALRAVAVALCKLTLTTKEDFDDSTKDIPGDNTDRILICHKCSPSMYREVRKPDSPKSKVQLHMAERIAGMANLPLDRPVTIRDLDSVEEVLGVNLAVVSLESGNQFVRRPTHKNRRTVYLYHHEDHYDPIVSITGFFAQSYFCESCLQPYSNRSRHSCVTCCASCGSNDCILDEETECPDCNVICRSVDCMTRHKTAWGPQSFCDAYYRCTLCNKKMKANRRQLHTCGEYKCPSCEQYVQPGHLCYQRALPPASPAPAKLVFYDFETTQHEVIECTLGYSCQPEDDCPHCIEDVFCVACRTCRNCLSHSCGQTRHQPNLVVAHTVCPSCEGDVCRKCGSLCTNCTEPCPRCPLITRHVFHEARDFFVWLYDKRYKDFTCVAHNAKGFDAYFVLDYLVSQSVRPQRILFNGTKLMYMEVGKGLNLRFIDSLNFFPMKLAALPKAFGLQEMKKGYFPHKANLPRFWNYRGPYLDPSYYGADGMSPQERDDFLTWHASVQNKTFDFRKELVEYCDSDVDILKRACLKYRLLMLETVNVDPFTCVTVASVTNKVFKTKFLTETWSVTHADGCRDLATLKDGRWTLPDGWTEEDVTSRTFVSSPVAAVPPQGYVTGRQFSKNSILWLEWTALRRGIHVRHALNEQGEKKFGPYWVDGYDADGDEAFEYHGCFWHGCPVCYPDDRTRTKNPVTGQSMSELHFLTQKKEAYLRSCGLKVTVVWEHDFLERLRTDDKLRDFADTQDLQDRLEPRQAFYGGRTNALRLYSKVDDPLQIRYYDVTSLYPYVLKTQTFPVGHPQIVTRDFLPLDRYFGLAKVKILPPRGLYLPVLPHKVDGRLFFPLCATCAQTKNVGFCTCDDEDRALVGTWCTPEILKAVDKGYRVLRIYEVYHFSQNSNSLFGDYVDHFLKIKQEASDWPDWCRTDEDRRTYLDDYRAREGVALDPSQIAKNPGKRSLAKIKLNAFWGKFGQRTNFSTTTYCDESDLSRFFQTVTDPTQDIQDFHVVNDNLLLLKHRKKDYAVPFDKTGNVFLAAFTTCYGRLYLYDIMEPLNTRVLYHDTDSIIYVHDPRLFNPSLGDYLGDLTDECKGDHVVEFVSGGPKNYAYRTQSGKTVCKVRGFRLDYTTAKLINFDVLKDLVTAAPDRRVTTDVRQIARDPRTLTLYNRPHTKMYGLCYTKRNLLLSTGETLPFGY